MQLHWNEKINDLLVLVEEFIKETNYPVTYNRLNSEMYLYDIVHDTNSAILAQYKAEVLAGFVICHRSKEYHNEYFGYISKMYVSKEFRGTNVGRLVIEDAVEWFDVNDCILSFGTATANISQDKLYINLLKKFGYEVQSGILIRKGLHI